MVSGDTIQPGWPARYASNATHGPFIATSTVRSSTTVICSTRLMP
jgi:hypothetical protein